MSDFEKDYDNFPSANKPANFDDFERLDDFPIHEQPEAEERESVAAAADGKFHDIGGGGFAQNFGAGAKAGSNPPAGGLHSTDRPLVTAEEPPVPEAAEIHLTPDPEEYKAEPFINLTAGSVGDIPSKPFGLDRDDEDFGPRPARPSAPEPSLFEPAYDKLINTDQEEVEDLLNFRGQSSYKFEEEEEKKETFEPFSVEEIINKSVLSKPLIEAFDDNAGSEKGEAFPQEQQQPPQPTIAICPPKMEEIIAEVKPEVEEREAAGESERQCLFHPRAWFNPSKLDPRVAELIYWRDVKKSGAVFGSGLVVLLSLTYFSFISVLSYLLLGVMTGTLSYRIYKNILQAVQKSGEGHPFKEYLDFDLSLPKDKVRDGAEVIVKHLECTAKELRRLFLVEDLVDSLKFAVMLWCFTYIGAWFNGLTLFIMAFVALFTLPKVYETYQAQIDFYLNIVCTQIGDIVSKVKAKIPVGKKPKQQ